jgi:hypothetical protein
MGLAMNFIGEFETHITVEIDTVGGAEQANNMCEKLQQWCFKHRLKFLHILLDQGVNKSQPMITRRGIGNAIDELEKAQRLSEVLTLDGFPVSRIKIEATPWSQGIPQSNAEASNYSSDQYFEHHIRLLLSPKTDLRCLKKIAQKYSAHLSCNALRLRHDNYQERFITQRCLSMGQIEARKHLQLLSNAIKEYEVISQEEEFVIYDNNIDLDRGWIKSLR